MGRDWGRGFKRTQGNLWVRDLFIIMIVVKASQAKTYKIIHFKYVKFIVF